jgi:hypothetical protein
MIRTLAKSFLIWLLMMAAESVHGALRELLLAPYLGDFRARQIGVLTGSAIILTLAYLFIEWIGAKGTGALWSVGLMWVSLTLAFEFTWGLLVFGYPWSRILEDYDISKGGLLLGGIVLMAFAPAIASAWRSRTVQATRSERLRDLPGDELIDKPIASLTHAVTIRRTPREVWPWLVQMGAGRAGWYSYDFIDNGRVRSSDQIVPGLQRIDVGGILPALPGAADGFSVLRVERERVLVLGWIPKPQSPPMMTWAFVLEAAETGHTRLLVRARGGPGYQPPFGIPRLLSGTLLRCGHFIMERRQLLGIATRAEAHG